MTLSLPTRTTRALLAATAAAALTASAAPAHAATITRDATGTLVITAAPGDQAAVARASATDDTPGGISLYARAGLSSVPADGCGTPSTRLVNCRLDAGGVRVELGDGADDFSLSDYPSTGKL